MANQSSTDAAFSHHYLPLQLLLLMTCSCPPPIKGKPLPTQEDCIGRALSSYPPSISSFLPTLSVKGIHGL